MIKAFSENIKNSIMKNNLGELQIFSITNENATKKKRIDVEYYQPFFEHIVKKVAGSKFELQKLEDITLLISNGRTPSKDRVIVNI